jgi:hypothetical protein
MGAGQHGDGRRTMFLHQSAWQKQNKLDEKLSPKPEDRVGWTLPKPEGEGKVSGECESENPLQPEPFHLALVRYSLIVKDFQHEPNFLQNNARLEDGFVRLPEDAR